MSAPKKELDAAICQALPATVEEISKKLNIPYSYAKRRIRSLRERKRVWVIDYAECPKQGGSGKGIYGLMDSQSKPAATQVTTKPRKAPVSPPSTFPDEIRIAQKRTIPAYRWPAKSMRGNG